MTTGNLLLRARRAERSDMPSRPCSESTGGFSRSFIGCSLACLLVSLSLVACGGGADEEPRPNILMILADDLGYSDVGAFGGEIATPNLDMLAASGRLLTSFRASPVCSPTRAMLMSGTDHHQVGMGTMAEYVNRMVNGNVAPWGASNQYGFSNVPAGYEGFLNDRALSMPELLRDSGYHTYMVGKWHLATIPGSSPTYRAQSFPNAKGFENSFALLQGGAPHFAPVPGFPTAGDLGVTYLENDQKVSLPTDFFSSTGFTDKIISYIEANRADKKPFFAYAAYTAPHWPLQAPDADIAKYAGRYDEGYEVIRDRRIAKLKASGLLPADFIAYPGLDSNVQQRPRWNELNVAQKASEARKMEIYAAMVDNLDQNIGRLIKYLKDTGQYERTLIVFASDNGPSGEGSNFANDANTDNSFANMGRKRSNIAYGERWAEVSAAPFRGRKTFTTEGGITVPVIVKLPHQSERKAPARDSMHIADLLPTFLEAAGVQDPGAAYRGRSVLPITGLSLMSRLHDHVPSVRSSNDVVAGELFGGRYVVRDDWKLVSVPHVPFGNGEWMLFNTRNDQGERLDLFASRPDVAARLVSDYEAYAKRVGVVFAVISPNRGPVP